MGSFGERVKAIRMEKGYTQEKLAVCCETTAGLIRHIEKNRRRPSYELFIQLCNSLNISPDYLLQDELTIIPSRDKDEVLQIISSLTPHNIKLIKEMIKTFVSHTNE